MSIVANLSITAVEGHYRHAKLATLQTQVAKQNQYLTAHPRANAQGALQKLVTRAQHLRIADWVELTVAERAMTLTVNEDAQAEAAKLDGCYVLKTDLTPAQAQKELVHDRYKDLASIEHAFRTCKTAHLEVRPIFLRVVYLQPAGNSDRPPIRYNAPFTTGVRGLCHDIQPRFLPARADRLGVVVPQALLGVAIGARSRSTDTTHASDATTQTLHSAQTLSGSHPQAPLRRLCTSGGMSKQGARKRHGEVAGGGDVRPRGRLRGRHHG